jgi:diacylglycerol kinase family enzyme
MVSTADSAAAPSAAVTLRTRAAAATALVGALAAVAVVVVGLLRDPLRLPLTLVAIVVALAAGWDALVHRGGRRYVAAVVSVAALVGALLLLDVDAVARLAVVVACAVVSLAAARLALHDVPTTASLTTRQVGPARRGVLLMNPRSGGGRVARFDLEREARNRGVTPVLLQPGDDLRALAERAVAEGADVVGMAGGDGSQALIADVAYRHGLAMVCVPAGTRNHFARDLGLDRDDVVGALDAFGNGVEGRIDLACVGDRVFVNNASLGLYASVIQSDAYRDAKLGTAAQMLPDLVGPGARGPALRFDPPDGDGGLEADLVLVSNNVYRVERLSGFGSRARLDQGVLGVATLAVSDRPTEVSAVLAAGVRGKLDQLRGFRQWSTTEFAVDSDADLVDVGVDGEALRLAPPLRFRSLPAAVRIRLPAQPRPAGVPLPRPGAGTVELVRILAGRAPRALPA